VLRIHFKSRDWRPPQSLARRRQDPFLRSVLTWFADYPSTVDCVYSLHNMVASGLANYDKLPGEWYGPGTACYVLRDLVEMHERQQLESVAHLERKLFRVHVAGHGTVYRDVIRKLVTRDSQARFDEEKRKKEAELPPAAHPLDLAWEEELLESTGKVEWDTALLLLIPLRLGLKSFNADYIQAVAHTFSLPQSVGVLGGRPRGARWFYGALSDGSKIFGLDPHTVQTAPRRRTARVNGEVSSVVDMSEDYLRSVHTTYPEVFSLLRMDPSIALGFYCRTEADLENVFSSMQQWKQQHPESPELFTVADASPDYSANISSAMNDMMLSSTGGSLLDVNDEDSDEDEYVMI
jgi:cysteine protease ATG4